MLRIVTPPSADPVSLAEAKKHLRVDGTDEDDLIASLVSAATQHCQSLTQRLFVTQEAELVLPGWCGGCIKLPVAPVDSVEGIEWVKYVPFGGDQQTLDPSQYVVRGVGPTVRIFPGRDILCWPILDPWAAEPVVVRFTAGAAVGDVPANVKAAIKLAVGHLYGNREIVDVGRVTDLPLTITDLMRAELWA